MPFKLSTRGHYAVLLMCELARSGSSYTSLSDISRSQKISRRYLEQIIRPLRESGLVTGKKGSSGGYALSKDAKDITIGQVIRVVEGPVLPVECVHEDHDIDSCPSNCTARGVWQKVGRAIDDVLDSITLENLVSDDTGVGRSRPK